MRRLFFHDPREFNELADLVVSVALPGFTKSLHVGLNLGGGDYYKFESGGSEMLFVHNDPDHADVYVPEYAAYLYSLYIHRGDPALLDMASKSWTHSLRQRDKWQLRSLQARISLERKESHDEEIPPQSFCGI